MSDRQNTIPCASDILLCFAQDVIELQEAYWRNPDNAVPPDTPPCGFRGEFCQEDSKYDIPSELPAEIAA